MKQHFWIPFCFFAYPLGHSGEHSEIGTCIANSENKSTFKQQVTNLKEKPWMLDPLQLWDPAAQLCCGAPLPLHGRVAANQRKLFWVISFIFNLSWCYPILGWHCPIHWTPWVTEWFTGNESKAYIMSFTVSTSQPNWTSTGEGKETYLHIDNLWMAACGGFSSKRYFH